MELIGYEKPDHLDAVFAALADGTRRQILVRLAQGPATVQELSEPFTISQPAISKHLKVLGDAGLITRSIDKQRRPAALAAAPMAEAVAWLEEFKVFWAGNMDQMDRLLQALQQENDHD